MSSKGISHLQAPLTINWAINNSCNFACRHCYSRGDVTVELASATIQRCLKKVFDAGVFAVNFGGGEPLLHPQLFEIAQYASNLGLQVSMNSNGWLIDQQTAMRLKEVGFSKVGISIDSHLPDLHDEFRGVKGSHQRAVQALGYLRKAGIVTSISTVICTINAQTIAELIALALDTRVSQLNFHNFKCSGLGMTNRDQLDLSPEAWQAFYRSALLAKKSTTGLDISLDDPIIALLGASEARNQVKGSVCGKLSLNIKSNGDMTPCGFIPIVIGNIVTDDLRQVWKDSPVLEKMRVKTATGKCVGCSSYEECLGGCTARALAVSGDMNAPDPHCWGGIG